MTQQVIRSRVLIPSTVTNIDNVSMDFTWEATGSSTNIDFGSSPNPASVLIAFYNTVSGGTNPLSYYMANSLSRVTNACQITHTDVTAHLDGTAAGPPFRTDTFTLGAAASATDLPGAVCAAVGYRANYGTASEHGPTVSMPTPDDAIDYGAPATHMGVSRPRARMRSRFFFGPLCNSNVVLAPAGGLLASQFHNDMGASMQTLLTTFNSALANQFNLVVWSKRSAGVTTAKNYYVNEAFATQNRRSDPSALRVHNWINVA